MVEQFIDAGHNVVVTFSYITASGRVKVKARVGAEPDAVPANAGPLLREALQPLHRLRQHIVVDSGHKYSAGHAEAAFWISPPAAPDRPPTCAGADAASGTDGAQSNVSDSGETA